MDDKYVKANNSLFKINRGLPSKEHNVHINCAGYATNYKNGGASLLTLYYALKNGFHVGNEAHVSFECIHDRRTLNFGQDLDQQCLDTVYQEAQKRNPNASFTLSGQCIGANTAMNYLSNQEKYQANVTPIKAAILESPSSSLEPLMDNIARNHVPYGLQWTLSYVFRLLPNYKWNEPTILEKAPAYPSHVTTLIGSIHDDKTAPAQDTEKIVGALRTQRKNVEGYVHTGDLKHAGLGQDPAYQQKVRTIFQSAYNK